MAKSTETTPKPETFAERALRLTNEAAKTTAILILLGYVVFHWSDLSEWLATITHGEAFGIKFDRATAEKKVGALAPTTISQKDRGFAQAAVTRAALVGNAVAGARILWLDTNLPNNTAERQVLQAISISVQRAQSPDDAMRLARQAAKDGEPYDLIISNISANPGLGPLKKCPVVFNEKPSQLNWSGTLDELNKFENEKPRMGFAFAEQLATDEDTAQAYMQPGNPRLIFYSGDNGGISSTMCARIVTNYADILLQNVVSALEESRWKKLPSPPSAKVVLESEMAKRLKKLESDANID